MNPSRSYLRLPKSYADYLGGVRWAASDNVLELADGSCFAFTEQVADFLEGFGSVRPALHFAFVVHLLALLRQEPKPGASREHHRLWRTFLDSGRHLRNAGAFCAELCRPLPDALASRRLDEICRYLRSHEQIIHWSVNGPAATLEGVNVEPPAETPPLEPKEFETQVLAALAAYSDDELKTWLKDGRGPVKDAAGALARALPMSLAGRLAALLERPRLAGATAFLRQLSGALTLPPRKLANHELPVGGYADVTTRGNFEQILPSQFALDEWDFFRRYAERELLYFRREEPHVHTRQELLILLDQGVRTWGDVRIVLGAALLAFGKQAVQRKLPFRLTTTGAGEIIDPLKIDAEELGRIVEASDLSPHPAAALERVLEEPVDEPRDVVLLTNPRSLDEDEVRTAARRVPRDTRLFAVTLDRHGQAGLSEIKAGIALTVRDFHVDFSQAHPAAEVAPVSRGAAVSGWSGPVEPIGFPFRFGLGGIIPQHGFDFDGSGRYLLTASQHGMLHLWNRDGSLEEILPRALHNDGVFRYSATVLGVENGFVVVGMLADGPRLMILHYDLNRRALTPHVVGNDRPVAWNWQYSQEHHCVIAHSHDNRTGIVVDLGTDERYATYLGGPKNRAHQAWEAWQARQVPPRRFGKLDPLPGDLQTSLPIGSVQLDGYNGMVKVKLSSERFAFTPLADGRPMLQHHLLLDSQLRGRTLALSTSQLGRQAQLALRLFRVPDGVFLGEYPMAHPPAGFHLSPQGDLLARQVTRSMIDISQVAGTITPLGRTMVGGFPQDAGFVLGDYGLVLSSSGFPMINRPIALSWRVGVLNVSRVDTESHCGTRSANEAVPEFLHYDRKRWVRGARRNLLAAIDRYGQVAVFDLDGKLICMFFTFRNRLAGWMPDGTRFGPPSVTGHAPSVDALQKFGQALLTASNRGGARLFEEARA